MPLEITDCENVLRPAIELLTICGSSALDDSNLSDALRAVEVMSIIQSVALSDQIVQIAFSVSTQINPTAQITCEKILLQLMAIDLMSIKR